jgi:predicted Rossmann-fold nucleotide-binding protein
MLGALMVGSVVILRGGGGAMGASIRAASASVGAAHGALGTTTQGQGPAEIAQNIVKPFLQFRTSRLHSFRFQLNLRSSVYRV